VFTKKAVEMSGECGKVICIIPARGGSKGIPRKNIRPLTGKPLIAHSIEAARGAAGVDDVYVSTDDDAIADVSLAWGAKVIYRPVELAGDTASSEAALLHALDMLEADGVDVDLLVFLQCTSPLRTHADIECAISYLRAEGADSLLSVVPSHKFIWEMRAGGGVSINYDYRNRARRQDMVPQYAENGSIYIFKPWVLRKLGNRLGGKISLYIMREDQSLDIDTEDDWKFAEYTLLCKNHSGTKEK